MRSRASPAGTTAAQPSTAARGSSDARLADRARHRPGHLVVARPVSLGPPRGRVAAAGDAAAATSRARCRRDPGRLGGCPWPRTALPTGGFAVAISNLLMRSGAKPGDLPVRQPSRYEVYINVKSPKALGMTI